MQIFFAGFLGGTSPTLALAGGYAAAGNTPPLAAAISAGIFGVLGGIVAHYMSDRNRKTAFIAGISAPGLISSLISGFDEGRQSLQSVGGLTGTLFSMSAYAQDADELQIIPGAIADFRTVILNTEIAGGVPAASNLEISGVMTGDAGTVPIAILPIAPGASTISIPAGVSELLIDGKPVALGNADSITVTVVTSPSFWGDVAWGFGGNRSFEVDAITALPTGP